MQKRQPFETVAVCILPDHLHALWQLPEGDADYATPWSLFKSTFSHGLPATPELKAYCADCPRLLRNALRLLRATGLLCPTGYLAQSPAYLTVITRPLRSALTIAPTELPVSVSTAPFGLVRMIACAPRPTAAPTFPAA